MKKIVLLIVSALYIIPSQAQDVVTLQDTDIYLFNPLPAAKDLRKVRIEQTSLGSAIPLRNIEGILVQQYIPHDTVTVYGVAMTFDNFYHPDGVDFFQYAQGMHYNAVLMERTPGRGDSIYIPPYNTPVVYRPLHYVDSLQVTDSALIKYCHFQYEFDLPSPNTWEVPCYEFYFNTPMQIFSTADTFYVGREMLRSTVTFSPREYCGQFDSDPNTSLWYYANTTPDMRPNPLDFFSSEMCNTPHYWGFAFPIIGFRCKPLDETTHGLVLSNMDDQGVTVAWYNAEEGATYDVRLVDIISNAVDTLVTTTDTSIRFDSLPLGKSYNVQVRKQCHYATVNYDTTVYSHWTQGNFYYFTAPDTTTIIDDTTVVDTAGGSDTTAIGHLTAADRQVRISPNPASGRVQVTASCGMTEVTVYNPAGEPILRQPASGHNATLDTGRWPAGVYVVHVETPLGRAVKKLIIQ